MSASPESLQLRYRYRPLSIRGQVIRTALWALVTIIVVIAILFLLWYSLPLAERALALGGSGCGRVGCPWHTGPLRGLGV